MSKVSRGPKSVKPKSIYRVKNWSSYNRALIARGSLTLWLDASVWSSWYYEGPPKRGAQYTYSDQAIERALTLRCLLNFPLRQTQGFIHSILVLMGLDDLLVVPNYSTLSRGQARLAVAIPIQPTQEPMHLVGDYGLLAVFGYVDEPLEDNTHWGFDFVLTRVKSSCDALRRSEQFAWDPGRLCVTRIFRTFEAGSTEYTPS